MQNFDTSPIGYIYGLFDPRFNQIRYIEHSINPELRLVMNSYRSYFKIVNIGECSGK